MKLWCQSHHPGSWAWRLGSLAKDRWGMEEELARKAVFKENLKTVLSQTTCSMAVAPGCGLLHGPSCPHVLQPLFLRIPTSSGTPPTIASPWMSPRTLPTPLPSLSQTLWSRLSTSCSDPDWYKHLPSSPPHLSFRSQYIEISSSFPVFIPYFVLDSRTLGSVVLGKPIVFLFEKPHFSASLGAIYGHVTKFSHINRNVMWDIQGRSLMGILFYPFLLPSACNVDVGCDGWSSRSHFGPEVTLRMEGTHWEVEKQGLLTAWLHLSALDRSLPGFLSAVVRETCWDRERERQERNLKRRQG